MTGQERFPRGYRLQQWTVLQRLGGGAFGEVYRVSKGKGEECYALKTESVGAKHNVLMMDVTVLREASQRRLVHFCKLVDHGRHGEFYFMVMSLVGKSLHDLRKSRPGEHFSMGTAIGLALQTLESVAELHSIGYLHRDIKPGNFSIGLAERREHRRVIMLDFGMCRRFIKEDGSLRRPRQTASFRGTPRYASLRCHLSQENCRADDLESWIYMAVELTTAAIPWRSAGGLREIGAWKLRVHQGDAEAMKLLFKGCPSEYEQIFRHVISLEHYADPDYEGYYQMLRRAMVSRNLKEVPYDWER